MNISTLGLLIIFLLILSWSAVILIGILERLKPKKSFTKTTSKFPINRPTGNINPFKINVQKGNIKRNDEQHITGDSIIDKPLNRKPVSSHDNKIVHTGKAQMSHENKVEVSKAKTNINVNIQEHAKSIPQNKSKVSSPPIKQNKSDTINNVKKAHVPRCNPSVNNLKEIPKPKHNTSNKTASPVITKHTRREKIKKGPNFIKTNETQPSPQHILLKDKALSHNKNNKNLHTKFKTEEHEKLVNVATKNKRNRAKSKLLNNEKELKTKNKVLESKTAPSHKKYTVLNVRKL